MAKSTPHPGEDWDRLERMVLDLQTMSADGFRTGADQIAKGRALLESVENDFQSRGDAAAQVVKDIMGEVQSLRKSTEEADDLAKTIAGLQTQLGERDRELEQQKETILQFEKRVAEQDQAIQASKLRVSDFERHIDETQAFLESERSEKSALQKQIEELQETLNTRNIEIQQGLEQISALKEDLAQNHTELATLRKRMEATEKNKTEAESARESLTARLADITAAKQSADDQIKNLNLEADGLRKEVSKLRENLEKAIGAETRVNELENALKEAAERANALEQQRAERAKEEDGAAAEQLANARKDQEKSKKELRELRAEIKQLKTGQPDAETPRPPAGEPEPSPANEPEAKMVFEEAPAAKASSDPAAPTLSDTEGRRFKLGEILWEMGVITLEQLEDALEEQRLTPQMKLGAILQNKGYASPEAVAQAVALRAGTRYVEVEASAIPPDVAGLIPARVAALHKCVPIRADEETLTLAMANALDIVAIEDVERVSQRRVEPVAATEPVILNAIEQVYEQNITS